MSHSPNIQHHHGQNTTKLKILSLSYLTMYIYTITSSILTLILIKVVSLFNLTGMDVHKNGHKKIPDGAGIAAIVSFLLHLSVLNKLDNRLVVTFYIAVLDDIMEMTWKEKIIFPILLACNDVQMEEMRVMYVLYRIVMTVFSCNCVNILSGINGIEIGQVIIILLSMMTLKNVDTSTVILFLSSSVPLLYLNFYPSKVFIGNAYLFFTGYFIIFIEHKFVILFYGLQILNFIISLPQILGFYYCPRHRMPGYDGTFLKPSYFRTNKMNMTLLNYLLVLTGPINEGVFCNLFFLLQVVYCTVIIFFIKWNNLEELVGRIIKEIV
ncbi:Glycosyltransferase [Trachipleistophora hominis]|uniref:UDP-N-acetylglucosamine--dolichyl-phosphate N-acetylglucosaminephosphotransferase n=1 Tax=Trachipleistophora hominis TaxID=72359 RepID=L7JQR1_TRAHO|nr:Glycosyltransferase [Trachipleistophora hominis]